MKLHKVTVKDYYRPAMNHIYIDQENIVATDSCALVVIPKDELFDKKTPNMFIKPEDWKILITKKTDSLKFDEESGFVHAYDKDLVELAITRPLLEDVTDMKYPDYNAVIPDKSIKLENIDMIGVDFSVINKVRDGLGADRVSLSFYGKDKCIIVTPIDSEIRNRKGLIMPCTIANEIND